MLECTMLIKNQLGMHARAAARFVQVTNKYASTVKVSRDGEEVDGKSIMGLLTLAAEYGSTIRIIVEGKDESEALRDIRELLDKRFHEE